MFDFPRNGDLSRFWQVPVLVVLAGLGASANAGSQQIPTRIPQVSVESGLPGPIVTAIVQDQQGFLWVGTRSGLGRFDGSVMTAFQPDATDPSAFPSGPVRGLIVTRDDAVWAAIEGSGLRPPRVKFHRRVDRSRSSFYDHGG